MGMGLIVQLTAEECKNVIPKIQENLLSRIQEAEKEVKRINEVASKFVANFERFSLTLDPLLANLQF